MPFSLKSLRASAQVLTFRSPAGRNQEQEMQPFFVSAGFASNSFHGTGSRYRCGRRRPRRNPRCTKNVVNTQVGKSDRDALHGPHDKPPMALWSASHKRGSLSRLSNNLGSRSSVNKVNFPFQLAFGGTTLNAPTEALCIGWPCGITHHRHSLAVGIRLSMIMLAGHSSPSALRFPLPCNR